MAMEGRVTGYDTTTTTTAHNVLLDDLNLWFLLRVLSCYLFRLSSAVSFSDRASNSDQIPLRRMIQQSPIHHHRPLYKPQRPILEQLTKHPVLSDRCPPVEPSLWPSPPPAMPHLPLPTLCLVVSAGLVSDRVAIDFLARIGWER